MGKECPKCGMTSDRDDLCTWCNADLRPPQKKQPAAGQRASAVPQPGRIAPPPRPGQPVSAAPPAAGSAGPAAPGAPTASGAPAPSRRRLPEPEPEPEPPSRPAWLLPMIIVGGGIAMLVVALMLVGVSASGPPPEPGEWVSFTSKDKSFSAYYPKGWGEPDSAGSGGTFVLVTWKGAKLARVSVRGASGAGAAGDAAAARERIAASNLGPGEQLPLEMTADGAMLEHFKNGKWLKEHPGYQEGSPTLDYHFAKTRAAFAEYSYTKRVGLLPVKMKGMRWASFQGDYSYHVVAEAPEKHWDKFKPIAEQIVGGVQLGGAAQ